MTALKDSRHRKLPKTNAFQKAALMLVVIPSVLSIHFPMFSHAQTDPLAIHETRVKGIAIHRQTQENEDQWAENKATLVAKYRTLKSEEQALQKEKYILEKQIESQQLRQSENKRQITETTGIRKELQSHLDVTTLHLEEFIARDLPFLSLERSERIGSLKEVLAQADTRLAEKYRRTMEALNVETEYGQSVEVYTKDIEISGHSDHQPIMAEILRVGRLALFFRTPDGKMAGHWDRVVAEWMVLPDKYRSSINDAMEMSLKRRTVEMVNLPLGGITPR